MCSIRIRCVAFLCLAALAVTGCAMRRTAGPVGMELPAIGDNERIISYSDGDKIAYTLSYDCDNRIPRWVAYDLTGDELRGPAKRNGKSFRPDGNAGVPQADNQDYRNSGWTRGHIAPAGDFRWSDKAMDATFYFTNCCPQTEYFNGVSWEGLESRVRDWAEEFGCIYVVSGPIIGDYENGVLGINRITIPDAFFKALLVRSGSSYEAIGFVMHNISDVQPYTSCYVDVNGLEEITGIDFFPMLDDSVEEEIEMNVDLRFWGIE